MLTIVKLSNALAIGSSKAERVIGATTAIIFLKEYAPHDLLAVTPDFFNRAVRYRHAQISLKVTAKQAAAPATA